LPDAAGGGAPLALLTATAQAQPEGHGGHVRSLATTRGLTVSGGFDNAVILWDEAATAPRARLDGHDAAVNAVAVAAGAALSAGAEGKAILWDTTVAHARWQRHFPAPLTAAALTPTVAVTADQDGLIHLLDPADGRESATASLTPERVTGLAFTADGRLVAVGHTGTLALYPITAEGFGEPQRQRAHTLGITALAVGATRLATAGPDRLIRLWDPATLAPLGQLAGHAHPVTALAFAPNGRQLASGAVDGELLLWSLPAGPAITATPAHHGPLWSVAFTLDGSTLLTAGVMPSSVAGRSLP
jgi:cytochrome c